MFDVDCFGCLFWLWIIVLVFVFDQVSKVFFQVELSMYQQIVVIFDLFSWILVYNIGVVFSFLVDSLGWQCWLFVLIVIVVSVILVVWLKCLKKGEIWLVIVLVLVFGGVLGNFYDCMVFGYVVDFILVYWQNCWYFLVFNLVDSVIIVGVVMLVFDMFRLKKFGEVVYG